MDYINRITDKMIERKLEAFGVISIIGAKGIGKTTSAKRYAKSVVEFQDEDERDNLLLIADTKPSDLLYGDRPRLFDEWQDAPKIWGAIRKDIDDTGLKGQYILTGSSSRKVKTPHTGTLRISQMKMYPMSLYEMGISNGTVSLGRLFNDPSSFTSCHSNINIDDIKVAICQGGWPGSLSIKSDKARLEVTKDLFYQTCHVDISNIDGIKKDPRTAERLMRSYARNICTMANDKTIIGDINIEGSISKPTYDLYLSALNDLCIVDDIEAWCPAIRSKTAIRASKKRNIIDPSLATAALGISPDYFRQDYKTLGFLFESLVARDLKVYSSGNGGSLSYYRDRYGLEADMVLHLEDGRYALIEVKLGQTEIEIGATHLNKIERLVNEYNKEEKQAPIEVPTLKIVITATEYGYRREDGVLVIPIGCLKD